MGLARPPSDNAEDGLRAFLAMAVEHETEEAEVEARFSLLLTQGQR